MSLSFPSLDVRPPALGSCLFDTAIGPCALAWGSEGLVGVLLPERDVDALRVRLERTVGVSPSLEMGACPPLAQAAAAGVQALLGGERRDLRELVLDMRGLPPLQQRVYELSRAIPPGRTRTYGELALELGDIGLSRAVGQALGANPFAPIVPCHRILAAGGRSGGFSARGGIDTKLRLLEIERARFSAEPGLFDTD